MTNLIKTTQLTRKVILDQIALMILDHQLEISKENLERKINLLLEDCKELTAEAFTENCRALRKQEMYGKLPANFKFLQPVEKSDFKKYMEANGRK
jgi:hypothetical protein